jgi:tricorn protease
MKKLAYLAATALCALLPARVMAQTELARFPTLHGNNVVFVAGGNLWAVDRAGGTARRLTSDPGQDMMPRFSPDGKWIAFTASYEGNEDVYVIPAGGGQALRLTHHSDVFFPPVSRRGPDNMVVTWTPDSKNVVFLTRAAAWNSWITKLYAVPVGGGLPVALPLDSGGLASYGPDGHTIAYNRIFRDFRTWKRYQGGLAQQVFTYDFDSKKLTQVTDWKGTNTAPMWFGGKIYYLSDRDANWRRNIWVHDIASGQDRAVTHFTDYDVDFPSLGDNGLAFQQGGKLYVLDLPSETLHALEVTVPDDSPRTQPHVVPVAGDIRDVDTAQGTDYAISPNGKRAAFSARGDIFTVPAEDGVIRNITRSSAADEDHPAWSPDGTLIAYTTDAGGAQQIAIRPAEGGAEKILTHFAAGFFYTPVFSPDGKHLAFTDTAHRLWLVGLDGGGPVMVAQDPAGEIHDQVFSPDSRFLAYSLYRRRDSHGLWIYDIAAGHAVSVSDPMESDDNPLFTTDGKYLLFMSARHEIPTVSESEFNIATVKSTGLYLTTLAKDTPSAFAPRSDEGAEAAKPDAKPDTKPDAKKDDAAAAKPGPKPVKIDFEGLMTRAVALPIEASGIAGYDSHGAKIFYQTQGPQTLEGPLEGEKAALHVYDLVKRKDGVVVEGLDSFVLSGDGTKILYKEDHGWTITDAAEDGKDGKKLNLGGMRASVEPRQEWAEMFENAWRLYRDVFFNPQINGVDWQMVHDRYAKLLPLVGSREDLNWLIGQVAGEIGNSHTYVGGGDDFDLTHYTPTLLLGADFTLDEASGLYRFGRIFPGDNTRPQYRAPLTEPGLDVKQGDYLLAVDGQKLKAPTDPYSLFVAAPQAVTLTIAGSPTGKPRDVVVRPVHSELPLREKAWIDGNRATVDRLSGGRVGYVYLSDMEALGMQQFIRQFYPQLNKQALIVDDRWNGGGFIDQIVLERLRRVLIGLEVNREGFSSSTPSQVLNGPKICLTNHFSASDGDIFPYFFRKYGLGKLLGTRTWGGVRGIRGNWGLLDGGYITIPEDGPYTFDSKWATENYGVQPDIELENEPGDLMEGHDKQLETAVALMVQEIDGKSAKLPPPPAWVPAYPAEGEVPGPK